VVVTDTWETIRELVACLEDQTVASEIELVAVMPPGAHAAAAPALGAVQLVPREDSGAAARAAGIRAASAEVAAVGETHVLPDPGWAEALLAAHDAGADVVLPVMRNANPTRLTAAGFAMDYGRYSIPDGKDVAVPTFNASFRLELLRTLEPLELLFENGPALDAAVRRRGARIDHPAGARLGHVNVERLKPWVQERVLVGLHVGFGRSRRWSSARRALYVLAAPAIAVLLFTRSADQCRKASGWRTLPFLALGCVLWAAGEAAGYAGLSRPRHDVLIHEFETRKRDYLRSRR
jgi:hypothetical protein